MKALALRVARLEAEATRAAIAEHRRCTGWSGPVILAPAQMTQAEWLAHFGQVA